MKHILIIPSWFQPKISGHTGDYIRSLAISLAKQGHQVGLIYILHAESKNEMLDDHHDLFIEWIKVRPFPRIKVLRLLKEIMCYKNFLKAYISKYGIPDITIAHSIKALKISQYIFPRSAEIWYYEHLGNIMLHGENQNTIQNIRRLSRIPQKVFCGSNQMAKSLNSLNQKLNPIILPPHVDQIFFNQPLAVRKNVFKYITVGDLDENKGHLRILNFFKYLNQYFSDWTLTIIGEGPEQNNIKAFIEAHQLGDQVKLLGKVNHDHLPKLLIEGTIYISGSFYESFGLHIAEAMAVGLPLITFPMKGSDYFQNKSYHLELSDHPLYTEQEIKKIILEMKKILEVDKNKTRNDIYNLASEKIIAQQWDHFLHLK